MREQRNPVLRLPARVVEPVLPNGYISKRQAARYLGIAERTLTDWMRGHRVCYYKIGRTVRFRPSELDKSLADKFRYDVVIR